MIFGKTGRREGKSAVLFLTKQAGIGSENGGVIYSAKGKHCPSNGKTSGCFALFGEKKEEKGFKGKKFFGRGQFWFATFLFTCIFS